MLGDPGLPPPPLDFFFKNGAIWCILGHILAFKTYLFFFCKIIKKNVAFADKSENPPKRTLIYNKRDNVSISRCTYASFSQNANLLRSFINNKESYLLPGII